MLSSPSEATLEQRLRLEGWSLHQRLAWVLNHGLPPTARAQDANLLQAWRQVVAPDNPVNFDKRLAWDGLTPAAAAWALDPDPEACPQHPPFWALLQSLRQAARDASHDHGLSRRGAKQPFVHVWRPAAAWALQTLTRRCSDLDSSLPLSDQAWLDLGETLLERLCNTAEQALWELFNQRRTPGQMLLAHLGVNGDGSGEPVHEAYDAFVAELLSSGYGLLLNDYPVLGRLLAVVTELWLEASEEMLRRIAATRGQLQQHFAIVPEAMLHSIQLGLSDPHRGGRAVAILSFTRVVGADLIKVVYKPKDMQVDQTYQDCLQVLNEHSTLLPLRRLKVLSCDGYGFMEWVEHRPCSSDNELARFYLNAGRTMAVLHLLGCTDCHYENLIACGDQLVLIDTETLLEANLRDLISDDGDASDLLSDLQTSMQGSVLRSGLLPHWLMAGAGKRFAFDVSALGIQPPPPEFELAGWLGLNSDGMMPGRSLKPCTLPTSLPVELGSPPRLSDFVEQLCEGFAQQLQEVMRLRSTLQQAVLRFSGQPRRLVARATRLYFTIQRQMLEPAALRNAVAHGLKLEQLSRSFVLASDKPINWSMFTAELLQMERLDIPFFEHLIDGEELPLPEGLAPIPGLIKASGLTAAQQRLQELDSSAITFQQDLIRGLKTSSGPVEIGVIERSSEHQQLAPAEIDNLDPDVYRQEAFRLGEELWEQAIRDRQGRPEWLGMDLASDGESFHFGLIGTSLYSGVSGIALLFAALAQASPEPAAATQWRERAWSCLAKLAALAERNNNDLLFRVVRDLPYGINGSGGILLSLMLLAQAGIDNATALSTLLQKQLRPERLQADHGVDVIAGVTGLIGPLLAQGTPQALALAACCGERLLTLQLDTGGWPLGRGPANQRRAALTGFSHGAAGMASGLARLAQATGEQRFAEAARRAVAYERSVFVTEQTNWPDFRSTSKPEVFMNSWCHGAPGILLSRLVLQSAGLADDQSASELRAARTSTRLALERIMAKEEVAAHLCCGVLGLTSLLRIDAAITSTPLAPQVRAAETHLIHQARRRGGYTLFSTDTGTLNLPALFTGKAGVALALLEAGTGLRWLPQLLTAGLLLPG